MIADVVAHGRPGPSSLAEESFYLTTKLSKRPFADLDIAVSPQASRVSEA